MSDEFYRETLGFLPEQDADDLIMRSLAVEYIKRTEEYDRTVCTGPIIHGAIMPGLPWEFSAIAKNAAAIIEELAKKLPPGKTKHDLRIEIQRENYRSFQ